MLVADLDKTYAHVEQLLLGRVGLDGQSLAQILQSLLRLALVLESLSEEHAVSDEGLIV